MFGAISRALHLVPRPAEPVAETGAAVAPLTAPVHVLLDEGLVRLAEGQLCFAAPQAAEQRVRLDEISLLSLFGNAGVTSPCLRELMRRGIPIVWRSAGGYYLGQTVDLSGQMAAARRAQYRAAEDAARALSVARRLVRAKIVNTRGVVRRHAGDATKALDELRRLAGQAERAAGLPSLLGIEGAAAAAYYTLWSEMIVPARRPDFPWRGRQRRPPPDPLNALLSYLYAVLTGDCAVAALTAGLDPAVGFLHAERSGRPALALDLLEPFRATVADTVALRLVNRGEVRAEHFAAADAGIRLTDPGRRLVLAALERRLAEALPARAAGETPLTWRGAIVRQARDLAAALRGHGQFASFERG